MSLVGIHARPDADLRRVLSDAVDHFVEDLLLDVEARTGAAALAVIEEDSVGRSGDGGVDVGVVEDDVGRLAAEFERDLLQIASGGLKDELANFGRAGEGDLVDVRMRGQRGAGRFAVAGNDVDDAIGNTGFLNHFAEKQCGERSLLGGLEHDSAASGQRGTQLPGGHQQREIPRNDLANDADGFANGVGEILCSGAPAEIGMVLPSILVAQPAM